MRLTLIASACLSIVLVWMACGDTNISTSAFVPEVVDFNFHVRPILSDRCFACHGPDANAREAELRLDIEEYAFSPIDSVEGRYAIVAGSAKESDLIKRVMSLDPEMMMPPPSSNLSLAAHEKEILERWIEQGAQWKPHWAFVAPQKTELPTIRRQRNVVNEIDHFVIDRLDQEGLKPSPSATKEKLIRRLSFDLRGLPPSLAEIDAFLKDKSEAAYEELIDRFLTEKTYGERMAMEWLDLARYADSHGYQDDLERSMWPWRDWVIDAFNRNMPYDDFVSWQLAGDLLPDATYEQKLATGFNRNHKITQEVGVVNEEYRVTYVLDRVNTFSTAFLGLTIECAQCHDHKYDPISQKEYYQLFSFFNNVPEKGRVDYGVEVAEPHLPLPEDKVKAVKKYINELVETQKSQLEAFISQKSNALLGTVNPIEQIESGSFKMPSGLHSWFPLDYVENEQFIEVVKDRPSPSINDLLPAEGAHGGGFEFIGTNYGELRLNQKLNLNRAFTVSFWIQSIDGGIRGPVVSAIAADGTSNFSVKVTNNKDVDIYLGDRKKKKEITLKTKETLPENKWIHMAISYDGSRKNSGLKIYMGGKLLEPYEFENDLRSDIPPVSHVYLGSIKALQLDGIEDQKSYFSGASKGLEAGRLDEMMFFNRRLYDAEISALADFDPMASLALTQERSVTDNKRILFDHLFAHDKSFRLLTERFREYKIRKVRTNDIIVKPTMVMADMDTLRPTFILDRGQYDARGEEVTASTPRAVGPFLVDEDKTRLGLAKWLFDKRNPLSARVAVNRYWQMIFGRGLVSTVGDFGSQGALPTHPALLDWLAVAFQESDWDVKALLKMMVMSATYCQSVETNSKLQNIDPDNLLLARGPQARLSAEMVRDHALALSGLLTNKLGGPSVKPYQPKGLWLGVASGNQSLRKYIQDHGGDLYRRSMYTFWKRTIPPPAMTIFDAPSREQCITKRTPTSTPMQALVLLNDPQFMEASKLTAIRMLDEGGNSLEDRIVFAFRLATSRSPNKEEINLLVELFNQEREDFKKNPTRADELLAVGEYDIDPKFSSIDVASYAMIANAIFNVSESILKG